MRAVSSTFLLLAAGFGLAHGQATTENVQVDLQPCIIAKSTIVSTTLHGKQTAKHSYRSYHSHGRVDGATASR